MRTSGANHRVIHLDTPIVANVHFECTEESESKLNSSNPYERIKSLTDDKKVKSNPSVPQVCSTTGEYNVHDRLVREKERREITSISRSQAWALEKQGLFPKRIKLGVRSVAWRRSDLLAWIHTREAGNG